MAFLIGDREFEEANDEAAWLDFIETVSEDFDLAIFGMIESAIDFLLPESF
jgi:hypothetical protein